jgi:23S rRNA (adenine2503-C2)-methyltransferase
VTDVHQMKNLPKTLRTDLEQFAAVGSLHLDTELISKDGTIKRAYQLADGQLIESVLMPYSDGRYTACISSQAGCAQGCVFCATGQMGFSRQLTSEEIFEQVARFASELAHQDKEYQKEKKMNNKEKAQQSQQSNSQPHLGRTTRLSNIVFMGMGEPLANYQNVKKAVQRIQAELGIGHRKITISTVGIVPNIYKMAIDMPQVRLAVSLHCATDQERTNLLPANKRYGGLDELMQSLQEYISTTGKRITLEWALIEGENDTPETAHQLGKLIKKWLRKDMVHVNVIPLNPTGGFMGSPSGRSRVNKFIQVLEENYGVGCTPRVRRGIDINAGCGQLKADVEKRQRKEQKVEQQTEATTSNDTDFIVAEDEDDDEEDEEETQAFALDESSIEMDYDDDWTDHVYESKKELSEADRLVNLVKGTTINTSE